MHKPVVCIPVSRIKMSGNMISSPAMDKLVEDIRLNGLKSPIEVDYQGREFYLRSGYHRYWAIQKLGWTEVNVLVMNGAEDLKLKEG